MQNEDYDAAKALKSEIDRLRSVPKSLKDALPKREGDATLMAFNSRPTPDLGTAESLSLCFEVETF